MTQTKQKDSAKNIPFIDLEAQQNRLQPGLNEAIARVLKHGGYIMGPEIEELEQKLLHFCGAKYAITCASGTDALALVLMALSLKPGDAVFVPTFTFAATAEVVCWLGASVIFVDVDRKSFNLCTQDLERAIKQAAQKNLKPKGIISVDLFGLPADYEEIEKIAAKYDLWLMDDAAQSFGASYKTRKIGTIGKATATSFFPAKPLGCYGDGGAIFTEDETLAEIIKSLRVHGKGTDKYDNVRIGMNGRLDTLQAAILIQKLSIFEDELWARQKVAERYTNALKAYVQTPLMPSDHRCAWAQYTVVLDPKHKRESIISALKASDIPSAVYYPKPLHMQTAYRRFVHDDDRLQNSEFLAEHVLSLPMHPYLDEETQGYIIENFIKTLST